MQRVFKTKEFHRWMRKTTLTDNLLCHAVFEMAEGLIDADLGGNVIKKRIALPGRGKSSGVRTLVATRKQRQWFFVFGFEKNERANIASDELLALQLFASDLLGLTASELEKAVNESELMEICRAH